MNIGSGGVNINGLIIEFSYMRLTSSVVFPAKAGNQFE